MKALRLYLPGLLLCIALSLAGEALVGALGLPLAGPVVGMVLYALWLRHGRFIGWSLPGALLLARWLGAFLVPVLLGLVLQMDILAEAWLPLALLMVLATLVTGLSTALLYRWLSR